MLLLSLPDLVPEMADEKFRHCEKPINKTSEWFKIHR